ncbi:hypothetical protein QFC22_000011 [Naganishia vaughanmartiniae]|uniref:Uncharacterized protein n=1 Tax=Naganishia vaughanmartiniae TaxID=1424756 RepID=A0ACC2XN61_9TREE|nr:hypothetical protein QFC22_000011 [Naganishia vaughanmartiniae]
MQQELFNDDYALIPHIRPDSRAAADCVVGHAQVDPQLDASALRGKHATYGLTGIDGEPVSADHSQQPDAFDIDSDLEFPADGDASIFTPSPAGKETPWDSLLGGTSVLNARSHDDHRHPFMAKGSTSNLDDQLAFPKWAAAGSANGGEVTPSCNSSNGGSDNGSARRHGLQLWPDGPSTPATAMSTTSQETRGLNDSHNDDDAMDLS